MIGNKTTLIILVLLLVAFLLYHKPNKTIILPDQPVVIVPEPDPVPKPSPNTGNSCDLSLVEALRAKKKLLIIFVADWCGFCKSLKNDISNINNIDKYVICLVNVDDESNKELIEHFGIKMIPTTIMVDPEKNKETTRIAGYDKSKFSSWLNR